MLNRTRYSFQIKAATVLGAALAVSAPSSASIIQLNLNQYTSSGIPLRIDVNGDSVNDLQFSYLYSSYYNGANGDLFAYGLNGAKITGGGPLASDDMIDATDSFLSGSQLANYDYYWWNGSCGRWSCSPGGSSSSYTGSWNQGGNTINGYLGFSLTDGVDNFFGWANLTMFSSGFANIKEIAFESCANVGIAAGQTASSCAPAEVPEPAPLALLAIGAVGVAMMRRRRKSAV